MIIWQFLVHISLYVKYHSHKKNPLRLSSHCSFPTLKNSLKNVSSLLVLCQFYYLKAIQYKCYIWTVHNIYVYVVTETSQVAFANKNSAAIYKEHNGNKLKKGLQGRSSSVTMNWLVPPSISRLLNATRRLRGFSQSCFMFIL